MATFDVMGMDGKKVSTVELSDAVFGIKPNKSAMHMAVVTYLANQRQGTQSTKTRAEVRGGGRKPWRQKGTGRARQGSIRSPQWTHGGIALGPKPRDYTLSLNKKVRRLAVISALSAKAQSGDVVIVENIALDGYKTKTMAGMFKALGADRKPLLVLPEVDATVIKSTGNIEGATTTQAYQLNTYAIMKAGKLVLTADAAKKIEEALAQ